MCMGPIKKVTNGPCKNGQWTIDQRLGKSTRIGYQKYSILTKVSKLFKAKDHFFALFEHENWHLNQIQSKRAILRANFRSVRGVHVCYFAFSESLIPQLEPRDRGKACGSKLPKISSAGNIWGRAGPPAGGPLPAAGAAIGLRRTLTVNKAEMMAAADEIVVIVCHGADTSAEETSDEKTSAHVRRSQTDSMTSSSDSDNNTTAHNNGVWPRSADGVDERRSESWTTTQTAVAVAKWHSDDDDTGASSQHGGYRRRPSFIPGYAQPFPRVTIV